MDHNKHHDNHFLRIMITSMIILYIDDQPDGQDELEQRHQELLARQRQLQEQYQVYLSLTQKLNQVIFL